VCGDGYTLLNVEECDNGTNNGKPTCSAQYGSTCNDCSDQCKTMAKSGGYCGNAIKETGEQCDGNFKFAQLSATVLAAPNFIYADNLVGSGTVDKARPYVSAICDHPPCQVMGERDLNCDSQANPGCDAMKATTLTCQQLGYDFAVNTSFYRNIQVTDWTKAGIMKYVPVKYAQGINFWYEPPTGALGFMKLSDDKDKNDLLNKIFWDCGLLQDDAAQPGDTDMIWVPEASWPTLATFQKCVNLIGANHGFKASPGMTMSKPTCGTSCKPEGCGRCSEEQGDGKIHGYVLDRMWLQAAPGARVTLQYSGINVDQVMTDQNGRFEFDNLSTREECGKYRLVIDKNDDNICTSIIKRPADGCLQDIAPDYTLMNLNEIDEGKNGGYWPLTTDEFSVDSFPWQEMMGMIYINPRPAKGEAYVTYGRPTWIDNQGWQNIKECKDSACVFANLSFALPWSPLWAPHVVWPTNQARFAASFNKTPLYSGLSGSPLNNNQTAYQMCTNYAARGTDQTSADKTYKGFVCARDYNWENQGSMDMLNPPYTGVVCPHLKWDFVGGCPAQGSAACFNACTSGKGGWAVLAEWGYKFPNITAANCATFCKYKINDPNNSDCTPNDWSMYYDSCAGGITSGQVTSYFRYANPQKFDEPLPDLNDNIELYFSGPEYEPMKQEYYYTAALDDTVFNNWLKGIKPPVYTQLNISVPKVPVSWREYWNKTRTNVYISTSDKIESIRAAAGASTRQDFRSPFWHLASVSPNGALTVHNDWQSIWKGSGYNTLALPLWMGTTPQQPDTSLDVQMSASAWRPPGMACWNNFGASCRIWPNNNPFLAVCYNGLSSKRDYSLLNFVNPAPGKKDDDLSLAASQPGYDAACKTLWTAYGVQTQWNPNKVVGATYGYNGSTSYPLTSPYLLYNQINW